MYRIPTRTRIRGQVQVQVHVRDHGRGPVHLLRGKGYRVVKVGMEVRAKRLYDVMECDPYVMDLGRTGIGQVKVLVWMVHLL